MRTILFFLLLICINPLFSQNQPHNTNMNDKQKAFMEAYDALKSYAKKYPFLTKMFTDAEANLLRQAKEICQVLATFTDNATGDNNQFKAQTVAFKKPNPDPIPDDDDPNTIKESKFVSAVLDLLIKLQTKLQSLVGDERKISIAAIKNTLSTVMSAKTPLGVELKKRLEDALTPENDTIKNLAAAWLVIVKSYDTNTLTTHYNVKENKAAYREKKDDKELWPEHLFGDIPTDTSFITAAVIQTITTEEFVAKVSQFVSRLKNGLALYQNETFVVDNQKMLSNWRGNLAEDKKLVFANLFDAVESLGAGPTIKSIFQVVQNEQNNNYNAVKLRELADTYKDCVYLKNLSDDLGTVLAETAINYKYELNNQNMLVIKAWASDNLSIVGQSGTNKNVILSAALKQSLKEQAKNWAKQPLPAEIAKRWEQSITADKNMLQEDLIISLVNVIKECKEDQIVLNNQNVALQNHPLIASLGNLLLLIEQADSIGIQQKFVKIWIDRQTEWINSISGAAKELTGFSTKKLKELEPDFQNAKFWFEGFKTALSKISKDSISASELNLLLNSLSKGAAALETEFSKCIEEQKTNIKNFVDSLSLFLPAGNVFLLSANYKSTIIKVNPTPAEVENGVKSAEESFTFSEVIRISSNLSTAAFKIGIDIPMKLTQRKFRAANKKLYPHFCATEGAQASVLANNGAMEVSVSKIAVTPKDEPTDILNPYYAKISIELAIAFPGMEVTEEASESGPSNWVWSTLAGGGGVATTLALASNPIGWKIAIVGGIATIIGGTLLGYSTSVAKGKTWVFPPVTSTLYIEAVLESRLNTVRASNVNIYVRSQDYKAVGIVSEPDNAINLTSVSISQVSAKTLEFTEPF